MIHLQEYNLPDVVYMRSVREGVFTWVPDQTYVVLGQRDKPEQALVANQALYSNIVVVKRLSGGHSVVLTPRTLVLSVHAVSPDISRTKAWFNSCSASLLEALQLCGVYKAAIGGVSDISIGGQKILGSSVYRSKDIIFWHAVLNVAESPYYISSLLAHPATEPQYRNKRSHHEFITSVVEHYPEFNVDVFRHKFEKIVSTQMLSGTTL